MVDNLRLLRAELHVRHKRRFGQLGVIDKAAVLVGLPELAVVAAVSLHDEVGVIEPDNTVDRDHLGARFNIKWGTVIVPTKDRRDLFVGQAPVMVKRDAFIARWPRWHEAGLGDDGDSKGGARYIVSRIEADVLRARPIARVAARASLGDDRLDARCKRHRAGRHCRRRCCRGHHLRGRGGNLGRRC
jgi:hypothetical protein